MLNLSQMKMFRAFANYLIVAFFAVCFFLMPSTAAAQRSFSYTGSLNQARYAHSATLLRNGKVLVAGGFYGTALAVAELYDPASGT